MDEKIIEIIYGKRGSGKSFLARELIAEFKRYLIFDPLGDYSDGVIIDNIEQLTAFWKKVYRGNFHIIYRPLDYAVEFEQVCDLVFACRNMMLLAEEFDLLCPTDPRSIPLSIKQVINQGRNRDISLIALTKRPPSISPLLRSQAKKMYVFNTTEPADKDYFKHTIGEKIVPMFEQLKQYEYIEWLDGRDDLIITKA